MFLNSQKINEVELNLNVLEFLYSSDFCSKNEYIIGLYVRKSFRKQKFLNMGAKYDIRTTGGKSNEKIIEIVEANRDWVKITQEFNENDIKFLEKIICCETTVKKILEKNNEEILNKILYKALVLLSKMLFLRKNKFTLTIEEKRFMLYWLVNQNSFKIVAKNTGINFRTLKKIINNSDDFVFSKFKILCQYFDLV